MSYWTYTNRQTTLSFRQTANRLNFHPRKNEYRRKRNPRQWNGHAKFKCQHCQHQWTSYHTQVDANWRQMRITRIYKQKCTKCQTPCVPIAFENFDEWMETLIEQIRDPDPPRRQQAKKKGPQHLAELCEACQYGANPHRH
jgi:hypothetical protein